jgi:predicted MFS family arabinose efflux permease
MSIEVTRRRSSAFSHAGFARVWLAGWLWMIGQFMSLFLASYLVNNRTHSPLLVQIAGMCFYLPMFIGGLAMGALSDRHSPRVVSYLVVLSVAPVVALFALAGTSVAALVYPLMVLMGICGVTNNVTRRTMVFDVVGAEHLTNSMALEMVAMAGSALVGPILAGFVVGHGGYRAAYLVVALLLFTSGIIIIGCPAGHPTNSAASSRSPMPVVRRAVEGLRYARTNRALASLLGITLFANIFYFSFIPLVPVVAKHLGSGALLAGVLAAGTGIGQFLGSALYALRAPLRRGRAYVLSPVVALAFLLAFSRSSSYALCLVLLIGAGAASAGFAVFQMTLVFHIAPHDMRLRAMGATATAIGGQPFGILLLGVLANSTTPDTAMLCSSIAGLVALAYWSRRHNEIVRVN